MADYPKPQYSNKRVINAGKALRGHLVLTSQNEEEIYEIFRIANDWRESHTYPMRRIRHELSGKVRRVQGGGITAARMKRMQSIRRKLRRMTGNLLQIQDLGGCRAILNSMNEVNSLIRLYRDGPVHECREDRSYIDLPKPGGYRSHHFVFQFRSSTDDEVIYDGRRIEVQIRTRLQHAWATAVEAIGLVRGEDLKAGEGNSDWLRLFELVSSEFAEAEGCAPVPDAPDKLARVAEIASLDKKLKAISTLDHLNNAIKATESYMADGAKYFLIQYNNENYTVDVRGYVTSINGSDQYSFEERTNRSLTTVLVEVDKVESLRDAYPNYFLDVRLFTRNLENIISEKQIDVTLLAEEPRKTVVHGYDLSFLNRFIRD